MIEDVGCRVNREIAPNANFAYATAAREKQGKLYDNEKVIIKKICNGLGPAGRAIK